jgi:hypothetical protein
MAIQNQSHGDTELPLAGEDVAVVPAVTDGWIGTTAPDEVLVGLALLVALEAALLVGLDGAVLVAEDVGADGDEGAELRVAVKLEAILLTADETLPLEPHAATSQVITTIRLAKTTHLFLTLEACAAGARRSATLVG